MDPLGRSGLGNAPGGCASPPLLAVFFQIEAAKLCHFEHDPYGLFRDFLVGRQRTLDPAGRARSPGGQAGPMAQG